MPSFGTGDALRQQIEILLRTGGTGDVDQLKDGVVQLNAVMVTTASVMRAAGASAEEMAAALKPIIGDILSMSRGIAEYERALKSSASAEGEAMRSRIDAYARAERAEEQWAQSVKSAMQIVRQVEGEAMRERAEAHARAERAAEADAAASVRAANQIAEADAGIARAEAMVRMAGEERARQLDAEAGRTEFLTKQVHGLDAALTAMHAHEASAPRAGTGDLMGVGAAQRERIEALAAAERGTRAWADSMERLQQRFGPTGDSAAAFGRRMLFVSYAMQDFYQGGFSAVLNNIPQLGYAFGLSEKMAGGFAIAALGVDIAFKTLGPAARDLARDVGLIEDPAKKFVTNVDQMKAKVDALTAKPHRLSIQVDELENAKRQLDEMTKNLQAFEAHRETAAQKDLAKQAAEVTEQFAGGTVGLQKAIYEANKVAGVHAGDPTDEEHLRLLRQIQGGGGTEDQQREKYRSQTGFNIGGIGETINILATRIDEADKKAAAELAGAFTRGVETAVQQVQGIARQNPDKFGHVGPRGIDAAEAIGDLPPSWAEAERRANADTENKQREKTEKDRRDRLKKEAEQDADVPEVDDAENLAAWKRSRQERAHDIRNRLSDLAMSKEEGPGRQAKIDDIRAEISAHSMALGSKNVADLNLAAERATRRVDAQGDAATKKVDAAAEAASKKLGPAFEKQIQAAIVQNRRLIDAGSPMAVHPEVFGQELRNRVGFDLQRAGVNPALAPRVVEHATEKLGPMMAAASARMGTTMDGLVDNQMILAQVAQQISAQMAQIDAKINHVRASVRGNRGSGRPTLQPSVRPGP